VITIRPAAEADASILRLIAVAAYQHYVPRIGRPPAPMTADYAAVARRGQAWLADQDGEAAGFIILIPQPGYLLLENVAVLPAAQGRGIGARVHPDPPGPPGRLRPGLLPQADRCLTAPNAAGPAVVTGRSTAGELAS
jgi:GNAT superfamily N-acetyltransferase